MAGPVVRLERDGALALVTLVHEGKFNAMSRSMWRELRAVFLELPSSDARCVLIRGAGGQFCAGGDISEYPAFRFNPASLRDFHENDVASGLHAMLACDLPIVAQIEGACMGAGLEIAACCDIRVAGASAKFGAPIARLGFPMAPREARIVAQAIGDAFARQLLLEARVLDASELRQQGFLAEVVADADAPAAARRSAERIAALAPQAARMNKQTLRSLAAGADMAPLLAGAYDYADSAEHREGIDAFLAKRRPGF